MPGGESSPIPRHGLEDHGVLRALWEAEYLEGNGFAIGITEGYGDTKPADAPPDVEVPKLYSHQPGFEPPAEL